MPSYNKNEFVLYNEGRDEVSDEEKIGDALDAIVSHIFKRVDARIKKSSAETQKASMDGVLPFISKDKEELKHDISELVKNVAEFQVKTTCQMYREQEKYKHFIALSLIISVAAFLVSIVQYFL